MENFVASNGVTVIVDENDNVFGVTEEELSDAKEDLSEGLQKLAKGDKS